MTLRDWIIETGPKKAAKLLKVEPATISYWKTGRQLPRPKYMVKINQLSKGKVSYKEMIETAARKQARKSK